MHAPDAHSSIWTAAVYRMDGSYLCTGALALAPNLITHCAARLCVLPCCNTSSAGWALVTHGGAGAALHALPGGQPPVRGHVAGAHDHRRHRGRAAVPVHLPPGRPRTPLVLGFRVFGRQRTPLALGCRVSRRPRTPLSTSWHRPAGFSMRITMSQESLTAMHAICLPDPGRLRMHVITTCMSWTVKEPLGCTASIKLPGQRIDYRRVQDLEGCSNTALLDSAVPDLCACPKMGWTAERADGADMPCRKQHCRHTFHLLSGAWTCRWADRRACAAQRCILSQSSLRKASLCTPSRDPADPALNLCMNVLHAADTILTSMIGGPDV